MTPEFVGQRIGRAFVDDGEHLVTGAEHELALAGKHSVVAEHGNKDAGRRQVEFLHGAAVSPRAGRDPLLHEHEVATS